MHIHLCNTFGGMGQGGEELESGQFLSKSQMSHIYGGWGVGLHPKLSVSNTNRRPLHYV